jgi:hypothetical protein
VIGPGPQIETKYVLTGPDGTRAVFNDAADPDYIGHLTDVTGMDSPDVRENAEELVQFDGGIHGNFYYGRRPIVLEGLIYDHGDTVTRNSRIARMQRASNAMRGDATLEWAADGSPPTFTNVRRQQPLRVTGGWNKTFQLSLVAADPRIYSTELYSESVDAGSTAGSGGMAFPMGFPLSFGAAVPVGQVFPVNNGNAESFPLYTIYGPGVNPSIVNMTTGSSLVLVGTLGEDDTYIVDTLNRTVLLGQRSTTDIVRNLIHQPAFVVPGITSLLWWGDSLGAVSDMDALVDPPLIAAPSGRATTLSIDLVNGTPNPTHLIAYLDAVDIPQDNVPYTLSFDALAGTSMQAAGTAVIGYELEWRNSSDALISTSTGSRVMATSGWDRLTGTHTAPVGTDHVTVRLYVNGAWNSSAASEDALYIDMPSLVAGTVPEYGDGTMALWQWDGAAYQSSSFRYGTEIDASSLVPRYSAVDFTNTLWGGLAPGANDLRLGFYSYSAGASLRVDYRDAWL